MNKEIVIVMGFPASGKSTTVESFVKQGYTRLNRDSVGGSMDQLNRLAEKTLLDTNQLVLDNLYPTVESRKTIVALGKRHKIPVRAYWMETSMEDSMLNACLRMMKKHGVVPDPKQMASFNDPNTFPVAVIYKYRKEFEKPTTAEGFDAIVKVPFFRKWGPEYVNKAIICDYDGTLRLCRNGDKFPKEPSNVKVLPNRSQVLKAWKAKGYHILGASNQSGVAKKQLTKEQADACFQETNKQLGDLIENYLYCPHAVPPISCYCRKPNPGMGAYFIETYKLNPADCIMVGDMGSDKSFAARCGFQYADASEFFK